MKTGFVNSRSFLEGDHRIDPDLYLSDGAKIRREIHNLPYDLSTVGENAENVFYGNIFSRMFVNKPSHGVEYLAASDTVLSDLHTGRYISKIQARGLSYLILKKGWILVTCSGTLGNVTYTTKDFAGKLATHDLIRIIPNNKEVNAGTLYAFLSSKYGYYQITQSQFGGVVKHINESQMSSVLVPVFPESFQTEVDDLIQESARLREEANDKLEEAIEYFNGHYPIKDGIQQYFYKKVSELKYGFAAYNNNLEVDDYIRSYSSNSFIVGDEADECFAPPMFKHIYLSKDNGYPFMTGSELQRFNLRYYRWLSPRGVKDISDYVVHKGTLLLYKSGTTDGGILGNVFIADNQLDGCCLSDHVIRVVFKDLKKAYWTYAFLKSNGGKRILIRLATGTMIPFITPEKLSDIPIPNPDDHYEEIIQEIEEYIEKSSRAKAAENKAITMVEDEIEKWNNAN